MCEYGPAGWLGVSRCHGSNTPYNGLTQSAAEYRPVGVFRGELADKAAVSRMAVASHNFRTEKRDEHKERRSVKRKGVAVYAGDPKGAGDRGGVLPIGSIFTAPAAARATGLNGGKSRKNNRKNNRKNKKHKKSKRRRNK